MSATIVVACARCGTPKTIRPSRRRAHNFCDRACRHTWRHALRDPGSFAIGKRRANDPYYAAREAARDHYDPEAEDRAILLARRRAAR